MTQRVFIFFIAVAALLLSGCRQSQEAARHELQQKNIAYSEESFFTCIGNKDVPAVKLFLRAGMDLHVTYDGDTPLHRASTRGNREIADLLISKGADIHAQDNLGETPLHSACLQGNRETAELLIEKGADVNAKDPNGHTPLHWASIQGYTETAALLIERGADVNAQDSNGLTPLDDANKEQMKALLRRNGAVGGAHSRAEGDRKTKPFFDAVKKGDMKAVKDFMSKDPALVKEKDPHGTTPLCQAVTEDHPETAEFLISRGADVNGISSNGETPLKVAKSAAMKALLRAHGAR